MRSEQSDYEYDRIDSVQYLKFISQPLACFHFFLRAGSHLCFGFLYNVQISKHCPPKTECGCLHGGVTENGHTHHPLTLRSVAVVVTVWVPIPGDPQCSAEERYNNNKDWIGDQMTSRHCLCILPPSDSCQSGPHRPFEGRTTASQENNNRRLDFIKLNELNRPAIEPLAISPVMQPPWDDPSRLTGR